MFLWRDIFEMKSSQTKSLLVGVLLCLIYYIFTCWIAYGQLGAGLTIGAAILFGSGFAGLEVSVWLLMPFSKDAKKALGFLLGVNGAISAIGWILLIHNTAVLFLFIFGLAQFFYFSCYTLQAPKEVTGNRHGS